jgi:hypothetical protein
MSDFSKLKSQGQHLNFPNAQHTLNSRFSCGLKREILVADVGGANLSENK